VLLCDLHQFIKNTHYGVINNMNKIENFTKWVEKYNKTTKKYNSEDVFLELKHEVENYLSEGFTIKLIYLYLKENNKFNYSYESFRLLVNKHIKKTKEVSNVKVSNYLNV